MQFSKYRYVDVTGLSLIERLKLIPFPAAYRTVCQLCRHLAGLWLISVVFAFSISPSWKFTVEDIDLLLVILLGTLILPITSFVMNFIQPRALFTRVHNLLLSLEGGKCELLQYPSQFLIHYNGLEVLMDFVKAPFSPNSSKKEWTAVLVMKCSTIPEGYDVTRESILRISDEVTFDVALGVSDCAIWTRIRKNDLSIDALKCSFELLAKTASYRQCSSSSFQGPDIEFFFPLNDVEL